MKAPLPIGNLDAVFTRYSRSDAPGLVVVVAQRGKPMERRAA